MNLPTKYAPEFRCQLLDLRPLLVADGSWESWWRKSTMSSDEGLKKQRFISKKKKAYVGGTPGPIRVESEGFIGGPS